MQIKWCADRRWKRDADNMVCYVTKFELFNLDLLIFVCICCSCSSDGDLYKSADGISFVYSFIYICYLHSPNVHHQANHISVYQWLINHGACSFIWVKKNKRMGKQPFH